MFLDVKENFVKMVNRRTANLAMKYLYSPINARWITSIANKGKYQENQLINF